MSVIDDDFDREMLDDYDDEEYESSWDDPSDPFADI